MDQYHIKEDRRSGIISDPNRPSDPKYIVRLIGQVIHVSEGGSGSGADAGGEDVGDVAVAVRESEEGKGRRSRMGMAAGDQDVGGRDAALFFDAPANEVGGGPWQSDQVADDERTRRAGRLEARDCDRFIAP